MKRERYLVRASVSWRNGGCFRCRICACGQRLSLFILRIHLIGHWHLVAARHLHASDLQRSALARDCSCRRSDFFLRVLGNLRANGEGKLGADGRQIADLRHGLLVEAEAQPHGYFWSIA